MALYDKISNGIIGTTIFRGILALSVAIHHADIFNLGYFPLLIGRTAIISFFVLSGWVIGWYFYSRGESINLQSVIRFYCKRAVRLYPVLLISVLIAGIYLHKIPLSDVSVMIPIFLSPPSMFNHVLWTLFVEIQFYILAPFVIYYLKNIRLSSLMHVGIFFTLFVIGRLFEYGFSRDVMSALDTRSLIGNACYFYAGLVFSQMVLVHKINPFDGLSDRKLILLMAGCFGIAASLYPISAIAYLLFGVIAVTLGALAVIELSRRRVVLFKQLAMPVKALYGLGIISYGYYVFHGLCLKLTELNSIQLWGMNASIGNWSGFLMIVIMPVIFAIISFVLIEKRIGKIYER